MKENIQVDNKKLKNTKNQNAKNQNTKNQNAKNQNTKNQNAKNQNTKNQNTKNQNTKNQNTKNPNTKNQNAKNQNDKNQNVKNVKKRKKKNTKWHKVFLICILIILVLAVIFAFKVYKNGGGVSGILATVIGHDENTKKNLGEFKVLLLGISTDQEGVDLTDTIIVASYNPNTQKATLLSIPRDTYTGSNPQRATAYEKINSLYNRNHRPDETLKEVNKITGLNIQYYIVVKTEALIKLVDAIGGVTFNVPIDMDYDDPTQDLHIHIKAGEQLLDGDKAEQVVRFRHNNNGTTYSDEYGDNDTGRMRTQRDFIMQVIKQTAKPENILKLGKILEIAEEYVITNINFDVAKDYIPYAVEFSTDNLLNATLPGTNTNDNISQTWIFVHDKYETEQLIQELFFDRDLEIPDEDETQENKISGNEISGNEITGNKISGNAISGNKTTTNTNKNTTKNSTTNTTKINSINKKALKLEVLNGSGTSENLDKVVNQIQGAGFKVTRTGSTNTTTKTTIINRKSVSNILIKNIKDVIGIGEATESESSSSKIDITIIIGKDYQ